MPNTLTEPLVPFQNADMTFETFRASRSVDEKLEAPPGSELRAMFVIGLVTVEATEAIAGGLAAAEQKALLGAMELSLKWGTGVQPCEVFQAVPLSQLRLVQLKAMETEVEGYGVAGKGLGSALLAGANEVPFILTLPLGHVESIDENAMLGVGAEQVRTFKMTLQANGDPLNAINPKLKATKLSVRFAPDFRLAPEGTSGKRLSRVGVIPVLRNKKAPQGGDSYIEFPSVLPIEVVDLAKPTATTDFKRVTVTVGDFPATGGGVATPKDIEAVYELKPDTGPQEKAVAAEATVLYRSWDRPLRDMPTGVIRTNQDEHVTGYNTNAYFVPGFTEYEWHEILKRHAKTMRELEKKADLVVHFISAAAVHDKVKVEDRFLHVLGAYACRRGDTEYATVPGLRFRPNQEKAELFINDILYSQKYGLWKAALDLDDGDTMSVVVEGLLRTVPYGFFPGGPAEGKTWARLDLEYRFRKTLTETTAGEERERLLRKLDALTAD